MKSLEIVHYDQIVLLGDRDRLDSDPADARSLVSLLELRDIVAGCGREVSIRVAVLSENGGASATRRTSHRTST